MCVLSDPALQSTAGRDPGLAGGPREGDPGTRGDELRAREHLSVYLRWTGSTSLGEGMYFTTEIESFSQI